MPKRKQGEVDNQGVQDFELIELLIREKAEVSQPGPSTSAPKGSDFESFKARFQSYVDQVPSYLHSVGKEGFFPHFFLGSFSTLVDTEIATKLNIEKVYFSFDSAKTLKVAVIKNKEIKSPEDVADKVKLFVIAESGSTKKKFSYGELDKILGNTKVARNNIVRLARDQGKLGVRLVEITREKDAKGRMAGISVDVKSNNLDKDTSAIHEFKEIKKGLWNNPESDIAKLTNPDVKRVKEPVQNILKKVSEIHSGYRDSLVYADQAREAAHHGFIAGALVNFRYRHNLRVYLEQFAGRGYADIVLVPRGKDRSLNAVPIIIELKAGTGTGTALGNALEQAKDYAKGFQPNTMRVLTVSDNVLCVGLNLDSTEKFSMYISPPREREPAPPTIQKLLEVTSSWNGERSTITDITEKIKQPLERIYHTFPGTPEKGGNYFSRFMLGQLLLANEFKRINLERSVFLYNEYPLAASTRSGAQSTERPVTTFMLTKGNQGQDKEVFIFHIREGGKGEFSEKKIPINLPKVGKITEVCISLQEERKSDFFDIKKIDRYNSLNEYKGGKESFNGEWKNIPYPAELKEKFDAVLESQLASSQDRSQSIGKYKELFGKLGEAMLPFKFLIEKEAHTQAVFHGAFSHYSDIKLGESQENRALVLTEFQTGRGKRIDMVVHGIKFANQASSAKEYDPVGLELKGPREGKTADALKDEANKQIADEYTKGVTYKTLTDGKEVDFIGVVFDKSVSNADSLILMSKDEFASVKVVHSSIFSISQQQPRKKFDPNTCVGQGGRSRRSINNCLFSKGDVEKFSKGNIDENNVDKVIIDSKKFLTYVKSSQDEGKNAQLIEFIGNKNIEGDYKYLVDKVIGDQGYERYVQNERIKDLYGDILQQNSGLTKNPKLKSRLMNAAGGIQLIRGIHGAILSCKDGTATDCGLNLGGIGWSFASQPIENVMVKITPRVVTSAEKVVARIIPGNLGRQTKFAVKLAGVKFGSTIAKGAAGAVAGVFDIIEIGISANNLVDCKNREGSDNPCGEKEIRDNIASIAFSGVSFVSGVALTAASLPGVGIGVGFGLMVTHGVYSGISNIIECEKKYDTTHGENVDIFLHTLLLSSMPYDLEHLAARNNMVNSQAKRAWKALSDSPNDVVAYGVGFGVDSDTPSLHAGYGKILMNRTDADTTNLSRVIPDPIQNATMICLPQVTSEIYEKGIKKSVPTAVHHCENTMVIADRRRMQNGTIILYNLESIDEGTIVGSNTLNNYFLIFRGNTGITGGNNTVNKFILVKPGGFSGKIIGGSNATNILDLSQSKEYDFVQAKIDYRFRPNAPGLLRLTTNLHRLINDYVDSNVDAFRYSYIGRQNKTDNVLCTYNSRRLTRNDNRDVFINSGGGLSKNEKDTVDNCKKVAIAPYTKVTGAENDYTFYIKTTDYEAKDLYSEIDVKGTGTVIFPETNLLDDCDEISYFSTNNTLSLKIGLGQGNQYTLDIKNYIKQGSNQPNFMLIDKNGSNIIPKIEKLESSITKINSFELHTEHSLDSFDAAENHYKEILINNKDYKVFGVVRAKLQSNSAFQHMVFGSSGEDIINFDQRSMFARGGNGSDMYVIDGNTEKREIIIDNNSGDKKLDMLVMPEVPEEFSIQQCNLHLNYSNTHVQVRNYLKGNSYRHLMVMNSKGETFIPYVQSMSCAGSSVESGKLSPFFHATQTQNMFLLPKDFEGDHLVIDSNLEDIEKYKDEDDLLLTREGEIPFIIRVEDFYNDQSKWRDVNFLLWNNGNFFPYLGLQQEVDGIMDYQDKLKNDYEKIIKEYVIDFTKSINITHNQDGTLTSVEKDEERIGVVILKDITPDRIRVSSSNTDLVFSDEVSNHVINIKNWDNSESYRISTLEFDLGLEPIIIRRLDRFSLSNVAEIQGLINKASEICQRKAVCLTNIEAKNNDGQTLFHVAAQEGKLRSIRFLIGKIESMNFEDNLYAEPDELVKAVRQRERLKSLINEKDKFGYTPLQYAAKNGKWDIVNLFLDKTAERNQDDVADKDKFSTSWTTVHYAVYNGDLNLLNDIFQFLSDKETIINTKDNSGWTPLHYAVYYNASDMVKFLVNEGTDISVKDKDDKTPLDLAIQGNYTDIVGFLKQTQLDKKLLTAIENGDLPEVRKFVSQGASVNAIEVGIFGKKPIHIAAEKNYKDIIEFLLGKGVSVDDTSNYGWTPLHYTASKGCLEVAKFLIEKGADINAENMYGKKPIHRAAEDNHKNIIELLLGKGVSINDTDKDGRTPLHWASWNGNLDVVKYLVGKGASINAKDKDSKTPLDIVKDKGHNNVVEYLQQTQLSLDKQLFTAVQDGNLNKVKDLVSRGANLDAKDSSGWTTLHWASFTGRLDISGYLIDRGADINAKDNDGKTPLHCASTSNHLGMVKYLISKDANIDAKDNNGRTPLNDASSNPVRRALMQVHLDKELLITVEDSDLEKIKSLIAQGVSKDRHGAYYYAWSGNLGTVRYLVERDVNVNATDKYDCTLLHWAALKGHLRVAEFLVDKGANVNAKDILGRTPMHLAVTNNYINITEFLLKNGANVDEADKNGSTPLHYAARFGQLESARFLIDEKANMNAADNSGKKPVHVAAENNNKNTIEFLLSKGGSVDEPDKNGWTPLHWAALEDRLEIAKFLVDKGANINAEDIYGKKPIHRAATVGYRNIIEFLLSKGVSIDEIDNGWTRTPLHWASDGGYLDVVRYLISNGANINAKDKDGKTPIDIARGEGHSSVVKYLEEKLNQEREKPVQRKRRHHHGDHNRNHNHSSHKFLSVDSSNQPEIAASSGTRPSSWINGLFGWVKGSVGGLFYSRAALSEEASNTASSIPQVDEQFAKASVSSSSSISTTLPSDGTDKKQENGGFFRDNIDYVNANIKQMRERQTPVKFKPSGGNTILEMGDHYLSQVDFNGTIMLLDLLIRKVTGQKYISTVDQSIFPLEAQGYALNITKRFEKVVEQAGLKSGVSMHRLNIDFVEIQKEVTGKIMSGKFDEISGILKSYVEKACPDEEAGKLSPKKFEKFIAQFNKGLLNQSIEQVLHNGDDTLEVDGVKQMSLEPQSYLSNASVHSHSEVSTCLSDIGVIKLVNNLSR